MAAPTYYVVVVAAAVGAIIAVIAGVRAREPGLENNVRCAVGRLFGRILNCSVQRGNQPLSRYHYYRYYRRAGNEHVYKEHIHENTHTQDKCIGFPIHSATACCTNNKLVAILKTCGDQSPR